jgi:Sulfate permease family
MILGEVETGKFAVKWPISWSMITDPKFNFRSVLSSAMVVAILGFFESMVGVKHLAIVENQVSKANRELVALGAVNGVVCTSPHPPSRYFLGIVVLGTVINCSNCSGVACLWWVGTE